MTYLNNELQVRRGLAERIIKLQADLDEKSQTISQYEAIISDWSQKHERLKIDYSNLIHNVNLAALKIPRDHRRQIVDVLPEMQG